MTTNNNQLQAMLVSLSFSLCRQSKQNKAEAKRVEDANEAKAGVSRVGIFYFQETLPGNKTCDALADLKSYFNAWRSEHNRLTRVWDSANTRLLPAPLIARYVEMDSKFKEGAPQVVQEFLFSHADWKTSAHARMGHLYDEDFPSFEECRNDIGWSTAMIPLPEADQWKRISMISADLAKTLESTTNERVAKAVEEARLQTWKDLIQPVKHIVDTLSKDKPRIFDSLIGNLIGIVDLVPAFNLTGDNNLTAFAQQCRDTLAAIKPDDLRNDPSIRKQTCAKAQALLAKFGELGSGRKFAA